MSSTITIPGDAVSHVREGLFCLLGDAAEAISTALERPDRDAQAGVFACARQQLARVLPLLDLVGWTDTGEPRNLTVDVRTHGLTVKETVDTCLPLLEDQEAEADINDLRRAEEGKPPRKQEIQTGLAGCRDLAAVLELRLGELA